MADAEERSYERRPERAAGRDAPETAWGTPVLRSDAAALSRVAMPVASRPASRFVIWFTGQVFHAFT